MTRSRPVSTNPSSSIPTDASQGKRAAEAEIRDEHVRELDDRDQYCGDDGEPCHCDGVHLTEAAPTGLPGVGATHHRALSGVEGAHPGGEQDGQGERRPPGHGHERGGAGQREQPDLGGGVEAEAEQQPDDVHPGRAIHRFLEGPEHPEHRPARVPVARGAVTRC